MATQIKVFNEEMQSDGVGEGKAAEITVPTVGVLPCVSTPGNLTQSLIRCSELGDMLNLLRVRSAGQERKRSTTQQTFSLSRAKAGKTMHSGSIRAAEV